MEDNNFSPVLSDKPTKVDMLSFLDYAEILSDLIQVCDTPATIGIFGEWGSGKTSLMMMIEDILNKNYIKTIWFQAWKYEKEVALWRALILRILEGLNLRKKETDDVVRKLYSAISEEKLGNPQINWLEIGKSLTTTGIKTAAMISIPIPGIGLVLTKLGNAIIGEKSIDALSNAISRQTIKVSNDRIDSIEQFEGLYSDLVHETLGKNNRLVILIDDLDRCLPLRALEVIETLKTFLDAEGCIYVVACDPTLIQQGLNEKYPNSSDISFEEYLEKIVQISFEMPPIRLEDAKNYINRLDYYGISESMISIITSGIENNPRKLKRFLNNLEIQRRLVSARGLRIKIDVLVKLQCITYRWKNVWEKVIEDSTLLPELQKYSVDTELRESLDQNPPVKQIFDQETSLQKFLSQQPFISDADLDEYIFLARTTQIGLSETTSSFEYFNPYIVGRPIVDAGSFCNREDEIREIREYILSPRTPLILLRGSRRIGKTSLLRRLGLDLVDFCSTVYVDMQGFFGLLDDVGILLFELARQIERKLIDDGYESPTVVSEKTLNGIEFREFIANTLTTLKDRKLVLMLDEFEVIEMRIREGRLAQEFLGIIRSILTAFDNFVMILAGSYQIENFQATWSPLFNIGVNINLNNFSREATRELINKPLIKLGIECPKPVVEKIIDISGGQPFITQAICFELVQRSQKNKSKLITIADLELAIDNYPDHLGFKGFISSLSDDIVKIIGVLSAVSNNDINFSMNSDEFWNEVNQEIEGYTKQEYFDDLRRMEELNIISMFREKNQDYIKISTPIYLMK